MFIKNFLWTMPFISFLLGYYCLHQLYTVPSLTIPNVIGKQLPEAVGILSDYNLNARLIAEKEDPDLPDYTIVSQTPRENTHIKSHQSIFLVVTRQPKKTIAPNLIGKPLEAIKTCIDTHHIHGKMYTAPSPYPKGHCFTQFPSPNSPLKDNFLIYYISSSNKKPVLWPNFRGKSLDLVQEFLQQHNLKPEIQGNREKGTEPIITDQRPLPGSIIDLTKEEKPTIQLYIK